MAGIMIDDKEKKIQTGANAAPAAAAPTNSAAAVTTPAGADAQQNTALGQQNAALGQQYSVSENVRRAQDYLDGLVNNRPKADAQLSKLYDQVMNREKFSYDINGDALYQQYKDMYQRQGQRAMLDTMGNAATLTGGYGNSYANTAGQQAYQSYLQQLNDRVPELYNAALNRYNAEGDQLMQNYSMAYGQSRDAISDWENERNYYQNALQYWNNQANADRDFEYNKSMAEREYAYNLAMSILANKNMPSDALLAAAGISPEDAKLLMKKSGGGGGGGGRAVTNPTPSAGYEDEQPQGTSFMEIANYIASNENRKEKQGGSGSFNAPAVEYAISTSEKAGTITKLQAQILRKGAANLMSATSAISNAVSDMKKNLETNKKK